MTPPIPSHDHLFLPAAPRLLVFLSTATFWAHLLLAGTVVGGSLFLLVRRVGRPGELDRQLDRRLLRALPVVVSLTITFGVAPLLFTQALYSHYFYSANILIGPFWLASLGFLLVGFVALYLASVCGRFWLARILLLIVAGCFVSILYIFTNNSVLHIMPEYWFEFHLGIQRLHVRDAVTNPRVLHNIAAALVISGLAIAWIGRFARRAGAAREHAVKTGLHWMLLGLVLQIGFGLWYVLALPAEIRRGLLGFGHLTSIAWYAAVALVAVNLLAAVKGIMQPAVPKWLLLATAAPALGLVGMLLARQYLRACYLARPAAGAFGLQDWHVQPQYPQMTIFAVLLVLALLVIVLALWGLRPAKSAPATATKNDAADSVDQV
ncbi:MAG: hypothetical protein JW810_13770 [Sedimentisphaerales bacterium]|nr:hypothetical protein [Sedimentisphaerales bacterium]